MENGVGVAVGEIDIVSSNVNKQVRKNLVPVKMWFLRRMMPISRTVRATDTGCLIKTKESRTYIPLHKRDKRNFLSHNEKIDIR